jgi:3-oxoacyl-[acyl-carrier protein] reductase
MPGSIVTEIPRATVTPEQAAAIVAAQSVPRRLAPADIVGPILFLSGDAAAAITGQTVVVDGGGRFV